MGGVWWEESEVDLVCNAPGDGRRCLVDACIVEEEQQFEAGETVR